METATRTLQITLPLADVAFLRRQSRNMGWIVKTQRRKPDYYTNPQFYQDLKQAEQDIAEGKGIRIDSQESLDAMFL